MSEYYYNFSTLDENDTSNIYAKNYSEMPHPTDMNYTLDSGDDQSTKKPKETRKLQDDLDHYKALCDKYQEGFIELSNKNKKDVNRYQAIIEHLKNEVKEQEKNNQQLIEINKRQAQQLTEINKKHQNKIETINQLKQSLKLKEGEIKNLEQHLEKEQKIDESQQSSDTENEDGVTKCQSNIELDRDIDELNDNIKKYVTNLKQDVNVNIEEVKKLSLLYKCSTKITNQKDDRLLIQAVLQRHVIETIFSHAEKYFKSTGRHYHLEADMIRSESELSELLAHASKCRIGNDEITPLGQTKLRQHIYSILKNRGFSDIFGADNAAHEHPFIAYLKEKLNELMNKLRTIVNVEKKAASENMAANIIREVIKIFWFGLKAQEPVVRYHWISNNTEIDKSYMEGNDYIFDDNDKLYVDLCYFPLIGRDLESNDRKISNKAKVFMRKNHQEQSKSYKYSSYFSQ